MLVIGLTGGIGTGKSEVARVLRDMGAEVIDADTEGHAAYTPGSEGYRRIVAAFGGEVVGPGGAIDRAALGARVFGDDGARRTLDAALHPLIRERVGARLGEARARGATVAVVQAPLLFQAGWDDLADDVWAVRAPAEAVRQRLEGRGLSDEQIEQRLCAQGPEQGFTAKADAVIDNDGSPERLHETVRQLWGERVQARA